MKILASILFFLVLASPCRAADYYVAISGSDSDDGSLGSPFLTVCKAWQTAVPGDTIHLRAGAHTAGFPLKVQVGGCEGVGSGTSFEDAVTIQPYMSEAVVIRPINIQVPVSYVVFRSASGSLVIDGEDALQNSGVRLSTINVHHIRFDAVEIRNAGGVAGVQINQDAHHNELLNMKVHDNGTRANLDHGVYISCGDNNLIRGGEYFGHPGSGIQIYALSNCGHDNVIDGVVSRNNDHPGIYVGGGSSNTVMNSLIRDNGACGIDTQWGPSDGTKILNNTITRNGGCGIALDGEGTNTIVRNNIVYSNGRGSIIAGPGRTLSNNLISDPLFADPALDDFRLLAGSPALDAGMSMAEVGRDLDGVERPQGRAYDIGAYERMIAPVNPQPAVSGRPASR